MLSNAVEIWRYIVTEGPYLSDQDRAEMLDRLTDGYATGYITRSEFDRRAKALTKCPLNQSKADDILYGIPAAKPKPMEPAPTYRLLKEDYEQQLSRAREHLMAFIILAAGLLLFVLLGGIFVW